MSTSVSTFQNSMSVCVARGLHITRMNLLRAPTSRHIVLNLLLSLLLNEHPGLVGASAKLLQKAKMYRIYLSPPHMSGREQTYVEEVFASNWIAPLGPQVDAFEAEFAAAVGARYALALSSGTAALHLALILAGVGPGDEVLVSTLTFSASANPIVYLGRGRCSWTARCHRGTWIRLYSKRR